MESELVTVEYVPLIKNSADGFTKTLNKIKFERFRSLIYLNTPPEWILPSRAPYTLGEVLESVRTNS